MSVVNMTVGATTPDGARFAVKVSGGGPVRVAVADNPDMTGPVFTASQAVDANAAAKVSITGLQPDTRYFWQVEDNAVVDTSITGQFLTHPPLGVPGTFTVGFVADLGLSPEHPGVGSVLAADRLSNHPVLDTVRERALAEGWPMVHWIGDDLYYDLGSEQHGIVGGASLANYRRARDDRLLQPRAHQLDREVAQTRQPDDHDRAQNNHDSTDPGGPIYNEVYREREPHYDLPDGDPDGGTYFSWQIRRVLFIAADVRSFKTGSTMLGSAQLAWMDTLLATSTAKCLVWLMPGQWMGTSTDSWASYPGEAATVVSMLGDHGWLGRMAIVGADAHIVALDTGGPNSPGGIPILQAAPIDAAPGFGDPSRYNLGGSSAGRAQYGTVTVADQGSHLVVTLTGWQNSTSLVTHSFAVAGDPPPPLASGALIRTLSGSHRALVEARVVTTFQTGPDPAGIPVPILAGDVQLDGTAEIRGTLELETAGQSEQTGQSLFPRRPGDLYAPYGHELFVRRGVDLGPDVEPLWTPLGYYRINSAEQDDAPYGPIRLSGQDRMAAIVEARPLTPREFAPDRTVASVFAEIVGEVYGAATIVFDDDSAAATVGRVLVMEDSRLAVLAEIATSLGKIMFWDGSGFLQVRTAPDDSEPVWEVKHGRDGVMVSAGRRVSREGVFNGWVVTGEAGESGTNPARGVAVDNGPNSPTRWAPIAEGGFGQVPRFFASPFITTNAQAENAAREGLRRTLGAPFNVDFGSVVNPTLVPYDPVRVEYADFNREMHVVDKLTIPLDAESAMSATTREKTLVVIGGLPS